MAIEEKEVNDWITRLGVQPAPLVQRNIRTVLDFFQRRMPTLDDKTKEGFLRGMDMHSTVNIECLQIGSTVAAYRRKGEALFKLFYTKPGVSIYHLGIVTDGRQFQKFKVIMPIEVLASRCASFIYASADDALGDRPLWDRSGGGGGIQYIIPDSDYYLNLAEKNNH